MDEISNKTLATLLVVAIGISLAGTFFAMRGVSQVTNLISGAAPTTDGTARVNITELTEVTLTQLVVDFGEGSRNSTLTNDDDCNLSTEDDGTVPDCWDNTTDYNPTEFLLENSGNNLVNLTINSSTADTFIVDGGTKTGASVERYGWKAYTLENACSDGLTFENDTYLDFDNSAQLLCSNLSGADGEDEIFVDINVSIPAGIAGNKTTSVTFEFLKNY